MFAMCSATDSFDIALSAEGVDICKSMFDGDQMEKNAQEKLNFNQTLAFQNFKIIEDPNKYEFSDIFRDGIEYDADEDSSIADAEKVAIHQLRLVR